MVIAKMQRINTLSGDPYRSTTCKTMYFQYQKENDYEDGVVLDFTAGRIKQIIPAT